MSQPETPKGGELCCDSIALWWELYGRQAYPHAARLLVLCDGGGSNSATQYLFQHDLQRLATRLGLEIRVAHYPPYCSTHNPIERRVFPPIDQSLDESLGQPEEFVQLANWQ